MSLLDAWTTFLQQLPVLEFLDQYLISSAGTSDEEVYRGRDGSGYERHIESCISFLREPGPFVCC